MRKLVNPFELPGRWYKANFHMHTTTSDGAATVAERVAQHRKAGYHVLAITDHNKTNDLSGLSNGRLLVMSGMEFHPACPSAANSYHLVAVNVPHGFAFRNPNEANACIEDVRRAGGVTILAHPHWCGHAFEDFRHLRGLAAVEVFNTTCEGACRANSESEWNKALSAGWTLPAVASDDAHRDDDLFCGWTWLRMAALSVPNVMKALRRGAFYASCGPAIRDFRVVDGKARVRCSPVRRIYVVGDAPCGERRAAEGPGAGITSFAAPVTKDWKYVRAQVTDEQGRSAWTHAIPLIPHRA